jgi:hypothetical protein
VVLLLLLLLLLLIFIQHFLISHFQILLQQDTVYEREQFQFEDDAYDTVADLITYYVGSGGFSLQLTTKLFY